MRSTRPSEHAGQHSDSVLFFVLLSPIRGGGRSHRRPRPPPPPPGIKKKADAPPTRYGATDENPASSGPVSAETGGGRPPPKATLDGRLCGRRRGGDARRATPVDDVASARAATEVEPLAAEPSAAFGDRMQCRPKLVDALSLHYTTRLFDDPCRTFEPESELSCIAGVDANPLVRRDERGDGCLLHLHHLDGRRSGARIVSCATKHHDGTSDVEAVRATPWCIRAGTNSSAGSFGAQPKRPLAIHAGLDAAHSSVAFSYDTLRTRVTSFGRGACARGNRRPLAAKRQSSPRKAVMQAWLTLGKIVRHGLVSDVVGRNERRAWLFAAACARTFHNEPSGRLMPEASNVNGGLQDAGALAGVLRSGAQLGRALSSTG